MNALFSFLSFRIIHVCCSDKLLAFRGRWLLECYFFYLFFIFLVLWIYCFFRLWIIIFNCSVIENKGAVSSLLMSWPKERQKGWVYLQPVNRNRRCNQSQTTWHTRGAGNKCHSSYFLAGGCPVCHPSHHGTQLLSGLRRAKVQSAPSSDGLNFHLKSWLSAPAGVKNQGRQGSNLRRVREVDVYFYTGS